MIQGKIARLGLPDVKWQDLLFLVILAVAAILAAGSFFDFSNAPYEDAAMLMRYASHVAGGHGIVWNIGEPPVDGATDFLFMVAAASFIKAGLTTEESVRLLTLAAHSITVLLVYFGTRHLFNTPRPLSFGLALYLALGPGLNYIAAYLGTTVFALFAATTWFLALKYMFQRPSRTTARYLAAVALITSLIRPEGVFLAGTILIAILFFKGWAGAQDLIWYYFIAFAIGGGIYFVWHLWYFGYPLPNPYYRKGQGGLHANGLITSVQNTLSLTAPVLWLWLLPSSAYLRRFRIASIIPVGAFTAIWILLSSEMNFHMRFQYALLPIALLSVPPLATSAGSRWQETFCRHIRKPTLYTIGISLVAATLLYQNFDPRQRHLHQDGRYAVGQALAQYSDRNFAMAVSEAGLLPLYSQWQAVDTWGLNDAWIAHNGQITADYLDSHRPELIMIHERITPAALSPPKPSIWVSDLAEWPVMIDTLNDYAGQHGYILAAQFGENKNDTHKYFIHPDTPDRQTLIQAIRDAPYHWYATGNRVSNLARHAPSD